MINILLFVTIILLIISGATSSIFASRKLALISQGEGDYSYTELSWKKSLKHTIIMYAAPILILILPFISGIKLTANDVMQAAAVYLAISYLKNIYC